MEEEEIRKIADAPAPTPNRAALAKGDGILLMPVVWPYLSVAAEMGFVDVGVIARSEELPAKFVAPKTGTTICVGVYTFGTRGWGWYQQGDGVQTESWSPDPSSWLDFDARRDAPVALFDAAQAGRVAVRCVALFLQLFLVHFGGTSMRTHGFHDFSRCLGKSEKLSEHHGR